MRRREIPPVMKTSFISSLAFHSVHTMLSRVKVALRGILADLSELVSFQCARQIKPEAGRVSEIFLI